MHISDISWTKRFKHPSELYKKGDTVQAIVLDIEKDNERFSLGVKQLLDALVLEGRPANHRCDVVRDGLGAQAGPDRLDIQRLAGHQLPLGNGHDVGHWTIEGAATSQFEQHLRAILGLPLGMQWYGWHHCRFDGIVGSRGVILNYQHEGAIVGLFDHLTITVADWKIFLAVYGMNDSWNEPDDFGTARSVVLEDIDFLGDGNGEFAKAIGMDFDGSGNGLGTRSRRYSMLVEDGVVKKLNIEDAPGKCDISGGQALLAQI